VKFCAKVVGKYRVYLKCAFQATIKNISAAYILILSTIPDRLDGQRISIAGMGPLLTQR